MTATSIEPTEKRALFAGRSLHTGSLTLYQVSRMSPEQRLCISPAQAKEMGLKVIDGVGGTPQWVGTNEQYANEVAALFSHPLEIPGRGPRLSA